MLLHSQRCHPLALAITIVAAFSLSLSTASGKRPGGNTSEGTIYYVSGGEYVASSPDGSDAAILPVLGFPSRQLHAGHHWFVFFGEIEGEFWPDGKPRYDLFAMRDDGSNLVRLTDDPGLDVWSAGPAADEIWLADDGLVTFSGIAWDMTTGQPVGGGIYVAPVEFDENDNVVGLDAQPDPLAPAVELPLVESNGYLRPEGSWSWSPDVTAVAWSNFDGNLHVTDFLVNPPSDAVIVSGSAFNPNWSPDGSRIVFSNAGDIDSIRPDGSDWFVVQERPADKGNTSTSFNRPHWSPDSRQLVFTVGTVTDSPNHAPKFDTDLVTRNADASGGLNLLNRDGGVATGWR